MEGGERYLSQQLLEVFRADTASPAQDLGAEKPVSVIV